MTHLEAQSTVAVATVDDGHAALHHRIAELREAVAARDTFLALAAHELRNPMTPILGQVDLLLAAVKAGRCSPEQTEQRLERIQHNIHRYLKRAAVLLDVSRLTRGGIRLSLEPFDLAALLQDVTAGFAAAARHAGAPITVVAEPLPVHLDRLATEQIVDNLVSNALKHGGRTLVEVTGWAFGDQVCIQVRDHGPGMPAYERARMLESFERVVGQGERHGGFGVGLWVVGQFAAAMQGNVVIGDAPGGGAVVTVTLPRQLASKIRDAQA